MEKFKAVEKAMKTKAYSKEGLSAAAKLDPKEQAKVEAGEFLSSMVDELEQQIESLEAESETIQATMKKGKSQTAKAERMAEIDRIIERHKWHQGKLEMIRRSLENGGVDTDQVTDLEETIRYYVSDGMNDDFMEDEEMYDELNLDDEEGALGGEDGKGSSQDNVSVQEEVAPEPEPPAKPQRKPSKEPEAAPRKASSTKSPLPALATLHTPLSTISNGSGSMKPASIPTRPAGEGLKYASAAAAAAAASEKNVGISPLPPPPGSTPAGISPLPAVPGKSSATSSPAVTSAQPTPQTAPAVAAPGPAPGPVPAATRDDSDAPPSRSSRKSKAAGKQPATVEPPADTQANGASNGIKPIAEVPEEESIYHLPSSLQDLVDSYETTKKHPPSQAAMSTMRLMDASQANCPDQLDADMPRSYRPDAPVPQNGSSFPREPLPIFDDPRLYSRIDPDTLFYVFPFLNIILKELVSKLEVCLATVHPKVQNVS